MVVPAPIPLERRQAAIDEYQGRKLKDARTSIADVAKAHGVGVASLKRWLWRADPLRTRGCSVRKPGLTPALVDELVAVVTATPSLRLYHLAAEMTKRAGYAVSEQMVRTARAWHRQTSARPWKAPARWWGGR